MNELDIIKIISKNLSYSNGVEMGIGDDCAVFKLENQHLVVTTDMMFKSTHFPSILTPFQIGMRVVTANVSDIAAMCAKPLGMVISMGFDSPDKTFIDEMSKGINFISKEYECPIAGGDTNKAPELTLSGTAFGITNNPIYRGGIIGEDICITGDVGKVNCALKLLEMKNKGILGNMEFEKTISEFPEIMEKLAEPKARVKEGLLLNKTITSCCDISDGLSKDLNYTGNFEINSKKLLNSVSTEVIEFCEKFDRDLLKTVLNSGEEFELLFTTPDFKKAEEKLKDINSVTKIGKVVEFGKTVDGKSVELEGYVHKW
ncbi:thiamine-phosphate kinase [Methanococcus maripaludis]|uniref:Thiamine-monophosphate kinase n=1 Tax=Methanococcus maripaludis TaxID=39152 RepID=A0A2L1CCJ5_METMI|nr:thiamine-phosphate kinase [Methanococcus maripaludis]AVB77092.1 Thiamine-monophosphate kinase [Methanococcus maripaludis]MBA2863604.1 thiamine-monophosphate kinase [Methanococcus maripaludis]MBB6496390.1 thiamine-monophosphate kinase [Methanococcus maripaludis]